MSVCGQHGVCIRPAAIAGGIVLDGASGQSLGTLKPNASTQARLPATRAPVPPPPARASRHRASRVRQVTLSLIALETGTRKLAGMQLLDVASDTLHEVGPLTDVHVVPPQLSSSCES